MNTQMNIQNAYESWLEHCADEVLRADLLRIAHDEAEIRDRFYRDLEFGTGGLRGEMAAGSNRMNLYTVGKATQGLADYLNAQAGMAGNGGPNAERHDRPEAGEWAPDPRSPHGSASPASPAFRPGVVIAYDTRNLSRAFARRAASVLCANGIAVHLFQDVRPTPMLSFAVRHLAAQAGIVITASHNPKQYNGYKVYGPDGGQITDGAASAILERISAVDPFADVKILDESGSETEPPEASGRLHIIGEAVDRAYFERVKSLSLRRDLLQGAGALKILYSPLHGSGNKPVRRVLAELGFSQVDVVPEQENPDGDFPTAPYPNPEEAAVFALAIERAKRTNPDLIFATDPDCDRIGVLCRTPSGEFQVLTGNQVGALLCEYVLKAKRELGQLPQNAAVVKTIVTTELARAICARHHAALVDVLTGFKYIGEKIGQWESTKAHTFLLGFEESYGYLAGDFVRDKDAVIAAALIAEMALYHKLRGETLYEALQALYRDYGHYAERLVSLSMPGASGQAQIAARIEALRGGWRAWARETGIAFFEDYKAGRRIDAATGAVRPLDLPESNVLKFIFADESWLVLRPSGTEPKMKLYMGARADTAQAAALRLDALEALAMSFAG